MIDRTPDIHETILDSTVKKLTLWFIAHEYVRLGHRPPYVHLAPPNVIHVIGVPRPSLFFALFHLRVLY